jgi:mono/diheme cytochrome c family protein
LKLVGLTLLCCAFISAAFPRTDTAEVSLAANPVFEKNCAKCHGKSGAGRHFGGPSLISGKGAAMTADELRAIINNGKDHMPKFAGKLTPEQIGGLVRQIEAAHK